ncbi:MAG: amino acid aminotransferase [Pseudomonadota bacterium]
MFFEVEPLPGDPILALMAAFREDNSPDKVDLGVGVYQDDNGATPVLAAVSAAEQQILDTQITKSYVGIAGSESFNQQMTALVFGSDHPALAEQRITTVQSAGGSGGLRVAAELLDSLRPDCTVWVSTPTWPNHTPLLSSAGLRIETYAYYDSQVGAIDEAAMLASIARIPEGDVLLLHGCCHNPTGADLTLEQWQRIGEICVQRNLLPFVDTAYQGFAEGLEQDAAGVRLLASMVPELIVVSSCSKNFGLYRERTGALSVLARSANAAAAIRTHLMKTVRAMISMPPDHGAHIVATILSDDALRASWEGELNQMRDRMRHQRQSFVDAIKAHGVDNRFDFIAGQRGMFSLLGVDPQVITTLREQWHIYIVGSGRINVAGLTPAKVPYFASALAATLNG